MMEDNKMNTTSESLDFTDLEAKLTTSNHWVKELMDKVNETTSRACLKWCNIVVKIGEPQDRIQECVAVFHNQIDELCKDMIKDMELYQDKIYDRLETLLKNFETICKDLKKPMPIYDLQIDSMPLMDMQRHIEERYSEYEGLALTRRQEINSVNNDLKEIYVALGRSPVLLQLSPLPSAEEVEEALARLQTLETEKSEREETFYKLRYDIINIASELGATPELDYERRILALNDSEVLVSDEELHQLQSYHKRLQKTARNVETEIAELRIKIDAIWNKLEIDMAERDSFRKAYTGKSFETLEALKVEFNRCEAFKKANLKSFIEKLRLDLEQLWQQCRVTQELRNEFSFFDTDCYTEDLLELHEREISKWTKYYDDNKIIFSTLEKHRELWEEMGQLEESSRSTNRYQNRGGELLKEEKLRNKLTKSIPKLEEKLLALADNFRVKNGRDFLNFDKTIEQYLEDLHHARELQFKIKLDAKKLRDKTPVKMQSPVKRKFITPSPVPLAMPKKSRTVSATKILSSTKKTATGGPRLSIGKNRRESRHRRRLRLSLLKSSSSSSKENKSTNSDYHTFTKDISPQCRSSAYVTDVTENVPGPSGVQSRQKIVKKILITPATPTANRPLREFNFRTPARMAGKAAAPSTPRFR